MTETLKAAVLAFIRGVRGPRQNPIGKKAIAARFPDLNESRLDELIFDLILEEKVRACPRCFWRAGRNNAGRALVYEAIE